MIKDAFENSDRYVGIFPCVDSIIELYQQQDGIYGYRILRGGYAVDICFGFPGMAEAMETARKQVLFHLV